MIIRGCLEQIYLCSIFLLNFVEICSPNVMLCYIKAPINSLLETCMKKKRKKRSKICWSAHTLLASYISQRAVKGLIAHYQELISTCEDEIMCFIGKVNVAVGAGVVLATFLVAIIIFGIVCWFHRFKSKKGGYKYSWVKSANVLRYYLNLNSRTPLL